jgi:hypothetical protein
MKIINGWKYVNKDKDRLAIELRISVITFFRLEIDISSKYMEITVLNFKVSNK